jgi:hypothetical protein
LVGMAVVMVLRSGPSSLLSGEERAGRRSAMMVLSWFGSGTGVVDWGTMMLPPGVNGLDCPAFSWLWLGVRFDER